MSRYAEARSHPVTENASGLRAIPSASCRNGHQPGCPSGDARLLISREGWAQVSSIRRVSCLYCQRYIGVLPVPPCGMCSVCSDSRLPPLILFFSVRNRVRPTSSTISHPRRGSNVRRVLASASGILSVNTLVDCHFGLRCSSFLICGFFCFSRLR